MKRIMIKAYEKGLVFKNGGYKRMLSEGKHWLGFDEQVMIYNMSKTFVAPAELNILLKDAELANVLLVQEVKDNEIALRYEGVHFKEVLLPGRYAYWKGLIDYRFETIDLDSTETITGMEKSLLTKRELVPYLRAYVVEPYEKGLLLIDGKLVKELSPGTYYFWKNAVPVSVLKADQRQLQLEISGQEILTKDKAAIRVNFYAQYKITSAKKVLMDNKDAEKQLYYLLQLALRAFAGAITLDELLDKKEGASDFVSTAIREKAAEMGMELLGCGIRDIILPGDVKDIMNQVLVAEKKAQANTIMRREETASARSLLNTAKLMEENTMLFKLKEMEYVEKIAEKINNISVSGNGALVDQLRQIFAPGK